MTDEDKAMLEKQMLGNSEEMNKRLEIANEIKDILTEHYGEDPEFIVIIPDHSVVLSTIAPDQMLLNMSTVVHSMIAQNYIKADADFEKKVVSN